MKKYIYWTGWILICLLVLGAGASIFILGKPGITLSIIAVGIIIILLWIVLFFSAPDTWLEGRIIRGPKSWFKNTVSLLTIAGLAIYIMLMVLAGKCYSDFADTNPNVTKEETKFVTESIFATLEGIKLKDADMVRDIVNEFVADGGSFYIDSQALNGYSKNTLGLTNYTVATTFDSVAHIEYEFENLSITVRNTADKKLLAYEVLHELGHYLDHKAEVCGVKRTDEPFILFNTNAFNVSGEYLQQSIEQIPEMFAQYQLGYLLEDQALTVQTYYAECIKNNSYKKTTLAAYYKEQQDMFGDSWVFMAPATLARPNGLKMIYNNIRKFFD